MKPVRKEVFMFVRAIRIIGAFFGTVGLILMTLSVLNLAQFLPKLLQKLLESNLDLLNLVWAAFAFITISVQIICTVRPKYRMYRRLSLIAFLTGIGGVGIVMTAFLYVHPAILTDADASLALLLASIALVVYACFAATAFARLQPTAARYAEEARANETSEIFI